jgi:hypothetical protein
MTAIFSSLTFLKNKLEATLDSPLALVVGDSNHKFFASLESLEGFLSSPSLFFLAQWVILIGPSSKKTKTWEAPQISSLNFLCEHEVSPLWLCEKGKTLGKGYGI